MDPFEIQIFYQCGNYATKNSITTRKGNQIANVVFLEDLCEYLYSNYFAQCKAIEIRYHSLENFLRGKARNYVRANSLERPWPKWNYEIMKLSTYVTDKRHDHNYFAPVRHNQAGGNSRLFVFYLKQTKLEFETERAILNKQSREPPEMQENNALIQLIADITPSSEFYQKIKDLVKKIQDLLDAVWPNKQYIVTNFGSTMNRLCFQDADIDLCIIVPRNQNPKDKEFESSVYNMDFLAEKLKNIGMINIESVPRASVPICIFTDPKTGFKCDINTDHILGPYNSYLIGYYLDLDSRIRPFIRAIKYFVKQKEINDPKGGTLNSYAYVLMAIHFLIKQLKNPVIPNIQTYIGKCQSKQCNYYIKPKVETYHKNQLIECNVQFHDCIQVQNLVTDEYEPKATLMSNKNKTRSIWQSRNGDTLYTLLRQFFEYYSIKDHFIVPSTDNQKFLYHKSNEWSHHHIIVQDPFILEKNVAQTCTRIGIHVILNEFQRAKKLLQSNTPFSVVCDKQTNIPRPIDKDCLNYRFEKERQNRELKSKRRTEQEENTKRNQLLYCGVIDVLSSPTTSMDVDTRLVPLFKLIQKIMSCQSSIDTSNFALPTPCTDLKKLVNSSLLEGLELKDLNYLLTQANFINHILTSKALEEYQIDNTTESSYTYSPDEPILCTFFIKDIDPHADFSVIRAQLELYGELISLQPESMDKSGSIKWRIEIEMAATEVSQFPDMIAYTTISGDLRECELFQ